MASESPSRFSLTSFLGIGWLLICSIVLLFHLLSETYQPGYLLLTYCGITLVLSAVAFFLFGLDKRRASREKDRISEKTLYLTSALGGWPGSLIGRSYFRHKTLKLSFRIVLSVIVALHLLGAGGIAWLRWGPESAPAEPAANAAAE